MEGGTSEVDVEWKEMEEEGGREKRLCKRRKEGLGEILKEGRG